MTLLQLTKKTLASTFNKHYIKIVEISSIKENIFSDSGKGNPDKGKPNKNEISNYRPVSTLNAFSKFYERFRKKDSATAFL